MKISEMDQKNKKKFFFAFQIIVFECGCGKFLLLQREYLSSAVILLTNSPKGSHITNRYTFKLNFSQSDEKYEKNITTKISQVFGTV